MPPFRPNVPQDPTAWFGPEPERAPAPPGKWEWPIAHAAGSPLLPGPGPAQQHLLQRLRTVVHQTGRLPDRTQPHERMARRFWDGVMRGLEELSARQEGLPAWLVAWDATFGSSRPDPALLRDVRQIVAPVFAPMLAAEGGPSAAELVPGAALLLSGAAEDGAETERVCEYAAEWAQVPDAWAALPPAERLRAVLEPPSARGVQRRLKTNRRWTELWIMREGLGTPPPRGRRAQERLKSAAASDAAAAGAQPASAPASPPTMDTVEPAPETAPPVRRRGRGR